jgi:Domain of unknown function (DUF4149)
MTRARLLVLALLAGLLLTVGGLVAPTLFAVLDDRALAGQIAGQLFHETTVVTIALVAVALALGRGQPATRTDRGLALAPAVLLGLSEWGMHPLIAAEKFAHGTHTATFAVLHGASSLLYAVATVAAVAALVRAVPTR